MIRDNIRDNNDFNFTRAQESSASVKGYLALEASAGAQAVRISRCRDEFCPQRARNLDNPDL